jgi:hypothetical protein
MQPNDHCTHGAVQILRRAYTASPVALDITSSPYNETASPVALNITSSPYNETYSMTTHFNTHVPFMSSTILMFLPATALSANGHSCPSFKCCPHRQLPSIERCSQQQPYLPLDISVSFPLLIVAPNNSLIQPWTSRCPFLLCTLLPTIALSGNGHSCSPPLYCCP